MWGEGVADIVLSLIPSKKVCPDYVCMSVRIWSSHRLGAVPHLGAVPPVRSRGVAAGQEGEASLELMSF